MTELEYCDDCKRIVGIGCACGMTFAEKIKSIAIDSSWMPNAAPIGLPENHKENNPNSVVSRTPPPPL